VGNIEIAPSAFGKTPIPAVSIEEKPGGGRFGFYLRDIHWLVAGHRAGGSASGAAGDRSGDGRATACLQQAATLPPLIKRF
jgi:hypothetical protein